MKNLFLSLLLVTTFMGCTSDDDQVTEPEEYSIEGRWHVVGFEDTVMYEFTADKRYTIYSTDGVFGDVSTAIPNPHDWSFDGEKIVIDLNFGNFLTFTPSYRCNGNAVDFILDDGSTGTMLFRENFDLSTCN